MIWIIGAIGVAIYAALVLFLARFTSDKWHPDGGRHNNNEG